jgi:hypothetical protein
MDHVADNGVKRGPPMQAPTWSTVSFVKDTPENLRRFVSYHLGLGATQMRLFFDDPNDPSIEMLAAVDRVTVIPCDPAFWLDHLGNAEIALHGRRQNSATTIGYGQATEDWVLNLDGDEFLHLGGVPVGGFLAELPDAIDVVRIRPAERVFVEDARGREHYRLPIDRRAVADVHGPFGGNTKRRMGFFGHLDGKSLIRSGLTDIQLRQHWPEDTNGQSLMDLDLEASSQLALLHRNAEDFATWRGKLDFRLNSNSIPGRLRGVLAALREADDETGLHDAYTRIFRLSDASLEKMEELDSVFALELRLDRFEADYF